MEPRIQYAKTSDGVSIAYLTMGEGVPVVRMQPTPYSHVQMEWSIPEIRRWHEPLAERYRLIRFDHRGTGLSQRDAVDFSLGAQVRDLEAVLDRLGVDKVVLMALYGSGPLAIEYAAHHSDRVSHLILLDSYATALDPFQVPQLHAIASLVDKDWELFTETLAHVSYGWSEESGRRFAAYMRECVSPEAAKEFLEAEAEVDVSAALPEIEQPTLVLQHRRVPFPTIDTARDIASQIAEARLVVLEGTWRDSEIGTAMAAIADFLGEGEQAATDAPAAGTVHTILFTDVEGSTALTDRLGDAKARDVLREHERITRDALKAHGGSEVKALGDGFMTSFSSATKALECAIAMQRALEERNTGHQTRDTEIRIRIGLNAGEPIAEDDPDGRVDLFGTAVNLAARIAAKASGGEILTSDTVRGLVAGKGFLFSDRGDTALRGFEDPVRLFEVRWRE
jgi:class 3 adenylate cyclase